jgi:hypothetical protein
MNMQIIKKICRFLASLELTVVCLFLAMVLIFSATLDQVDLGLYFMKKKYFSGFFVWWPVSSGSEIPVFPSGLVLGGTLLVNLVFAHWVRFRFVWSKFGIWLIHLGLIVLLVGGGLTYFSAIESQLPIPIGGKAVYSQSAELLEVAIVRQGVVQDDVVAIPETLLKSDVDVVVPGFGFSVKPKQLFVNAELRVMGTPSSTLANRGLGQNVRVIPMPLVKKEVMMNNRVVALEIIAGGKSEGTWLLSNVFEKPQEFQVDGTTYQIALRPVRYYLPYVVQLQEFIHDKHPGTGIAKSFVSRIRIQDPKSGEIRDAVISMNQPLRFRGKTFYQASFDEKNKMSVLQVVENPSWIFPYVSCVMISLGLLIHFVSHLWKYLKRRSSANA